MKKINIAILTMIMSTMVGCSTAPSSESQNVAKATITEESLGLRKTSLYTEKKTIAEKTEYTGMQAGTSERFQRAYTNAPPMIPHDIQGLDIIEKNNNQCVGCHMPDVAKLVGATPIPKSHFKNWRPRSGCMDNAFVTEANVLANKVFSRTLKEKLYKGRYNCTQCHAPQSQGNLAVENTFRPDFQDDSEKMRSYLLDSLNEGVNLSE